MHFFLKVFKLAFLMMSYYTAAVQERKSNANSLEEFLDGALGFVDDSFEVFLDVSVGGAVAFERVDDDTGAEEF